MTNNASLETFALKAGTDILSQEIYRLGYEKAYPEKFKKLNELDYNLNHLAPDLELHPSHRSRLCINLISGLESGYSPSRIKNDLVEDFEYFRLMEDYCNDDLEAACISLFRIVDTLDLKLHCSNHLYPAHVLVGNKDYEQYVILYFYQKFYKEFNFNYLGLGPYEMVRPYRRAFYHIDTKTRNKEKPRKEFKEFENSKAMEYQAEHWADYCYDEETSYEIVEEVSLKISMKTPISGQEVDLIVNDIRNTIADIQNTNRRNLLICSSAEDDYKQHGDSEILEGMSFSDFTNNTVKLVDLNNVNGVTSYFAALKLIKRRNEHLGGVEQENKLEDDLIDVSEELREFVETSSDMHTTHALSSLDEENQKIEKRYEKKKKYLGLAESTIKAKRAEILKAVDSVYELIRNGEDSYMPTSKLRSKK